jgi:hypothetical protein
MLSAGHKTSKQGCGVINRLLNLSSTTNFEGPNTFSFLTGSPLLTYKVPEQAGSQFASFDLSTDVYIILQGRVRLVSTSQYRYRPCSAAVLGVGDIFGGDHLFCSEPFSYRAVAASSCKVHRVPYSQLVVLFNQYPELQTGLIRQIQKRAKLIFFKQLTRLYSLPSRLLENLLLPRLGEGCLTSGEVLARAINPFAGYFWLKSGTLHCPSVSAYTMPVGFGWSHRDTHLADWVAATPVQLYQLPLPCGEMAELMPILERLG